MKAFCLSILISITTVSQAVVRVACIGDSITAGYGLTNPVKESYPACLQVALGEKYQVRNFGRSGSGVYLHTQRTVNEPRGYRHHSEHRSALAWKPDIVICNLGINDCADWDASGAKQFIADYQVLLNDYIDLPNPPRVYIWTKLAPLGPRNHFYRSAAPFLMQAALEEIAKTLQVDVIDLQTPLLPLLTNHFPDDLHPDATASKVIADTVSGAIKRSTKLTLARYCTDNMVVPVGGHKPFFFQGTARPGVTIQSTLGDCKAGRNGHWQIAAQSPLPQMVTFSDGDSTVVLKNLIEGDLVLCAGQSNQVWPLRLCDTAKEELSTWRDGVRILQSGRPWQIATVENAAKMPGLAMLLGQRLTKTRNRPIGVVMCAVGGAPTESFLPESLMANYSTLLPVLTTRKPIAQNDAYIPAWPKRNPQPLFAPAAIWEMQLSSIIDLPYQYILWYQGESNATSTHDNRPLPLPYMRDTLLAITTLLQNCSEAPCAMVELPGKMNRNWEPYRRLQREVCRQAGWHLVPTSDLGHPTNVHPSDKAPIADRALDLWLSTERRCTQ